MSGTRLPRTLVSAGVALAVCLVCVVAVAVDGRAAAYTLAGVLAGAGVLRLVLPSRWIPVVRTRTFDVATVWLLALAVALLAPWGNAVATTI